MNTANVYENLYTNMKNGLTVVNNGLEYSLGEYMLMKAGKKTAKAPLPVKKTAVTDKPISTIFKYISDKLAVKTLPVKDKTIRTFPLRTSMAALLTAIIACTLMFSYGFAAVRSITSTPDSAIIEVVDTKDAANELETLITEK